MLKLGKLKLFGGKKKQDAEIERLKAEIEALKLAATTSKLPHIAALQPPGGAEAEAAAVEEAQIVDEEAEAAAVEEEAQIVDEDDWKLPPRKLLPKTKPTSVVKPPPMELQELLHKYVGTCQEVNEGVVLYLGKAALVYDIAMFLVVGDTPVREGKQVNIIMRGVTFTAEVAIPFLPHYPHFFIVEVEDTVLPSGFEEMGPLSRGYMFGEVLLLRPSMCLMGTIPEAAMEVEHVPVQVPIEGAKGGDVVLKLERGCYKVAGVVAPGGLEAFPTYASGNYAMEALRSNAYWKKYPRREVPFKHPWLP